MNHHCSKCDKIIEKFINELSAHLNSIPKKQKKTKLPKKERKFQTSEEYWGLSKIPEKKDSVWGWHFNL